MKQLLLENPRRRRRRVKRNAVRTPLSKLYPNKPIATGMVDEEYRSRFDEIFRKKKKRKSTKRKKTMAKSRRRRRKGSRKGKLPAGLRRYMAAKRAAKKSSRRRRKSSARRTRRSRRSSSRRSTRRSARRGTRTRRRSRSRRSVRRRTRRSRRRSSLRTITIPSTRSKRRTYTMKIRVNRRRGGRNLRGFVSQFTSRENLSLAGGVLLAPIVTGYVAGLLPAGIRNIGGANTPLNKALIAAGVAGLGAMLTNRFSPAIAKGMVIGGLATAIGQFIPTGTTTAAAGRYLGEYLDPSRRGMGAYIAPQRMGGIPSAFNAWAK